MTKKEALQSLAYYQSDLFRQKEADFDKTILYIPYVDLLSDSLLGENKQQYMAQTGHKLYDLLGWRQELNNLVKVCRKIANSNNWSNWKNRFSYLFDKLSPEAQDFINKNSL